MDDAQLNVTFSGDLGPLQKAVAAAGALLSTFAVDLASLADKAAQSGRATGAALSQGIAATGPAAAAALSAASKAASQIAAVEGKAIDQQIKSLQAGLRATTVVLDAEVAQHKLSQNAKFAALEAETQKEYQAELDLLRKKSELEGASAAQREATAAKIVDIEQKRQLALIKLDEQSIAAQQALWDGYFSTLQSAFNSQISGLIKGTTTWSSAFKSVLVDLLTKFVEMAEKMAFQWAASEIAQTTATTSGAAARASADLGAAAASSAGTASAVLHSIEASAAETFAGIFGFLAPVMGPAAVGPAAAGQATVSAAAAGVASFAVGAWALPDDMIAQVHKGEMIVPAAHAPWAQSLMASAARAPSGGDMHVHHATHFNVSALDSRDVSRWLKGSGKTILQTIDASIRNGVHLSLRSFGG